jgi:hypothetical protein
MSQWWVSRSSRGVVIFGSPKHGRPLAKRQVGGDDHGGPFVEFADEVEVRIGRRAELDSYADRYPSKSLSNFTMFLANSASTSGEFKVLTRPAD